MKIYRVQSKVTGRGWYNHQHVDDDWFDSSNGTALNYTHSVFTASLFTTESHPSPRQDGIEEFSTAHFFGFDSYERLVEWFGQKLINHINEGIFREWFEICVYECPDEDVLFGKSQVAFIMDKATRVFD